MLALAAALLLQDGAAVVPPPVVETAPQPAAIPAIADEDMRLFAALNGRKVAGRPVGGPYPTADKILLLTRDRNGNPEIGGSLAMPYWCAAYHLFGAAALFAKAEKVGAAAGP
jgi:hypothetical protein